MNIKEAIAKTEQEFLRIFASYEERPYGTLFYNTRIKDHHDSNHAILNTSKIDDLHEALVDIRDFYESRGITPAIYHPTAENYFIEHAQLLKSNGYEFMTSPDLRMMVLKAKDPQPLQGNLEIKRITEREMIETGSYFIEQDEYLTEIYRNCIQNPNGYLFVGYYEGIPVTLLSFHVSDYGCTRFDEMKTARDYKNRGFAREMNRFAANYCISNRLPTAYQWPAHGTSERITTEAGFEVSFTLPSGYAAYAVMEHCNE